MFWQIFQKLGDAANSLLDFKSSFEMAMNMIESRIAELENKARHTEDLEKRYSHLLSKLEKYNPELFKDEEELKP